MNRSLTTILLLMFAALLPMGTVVAQAVKEIAYPLVRVYADKEYKAGKRNYAVASDSRGVIYVGNENGILEFDGSRWRSIGMPAGTVVRALATDSKGRVYVGLDGGFGYLQPDSLGEMVYKALSDELPEKSLLGSFLNVHAGADVAYFVSLNKVVVYKDGKLSELGLPNTLLRNPSFFVDNKLYLNIAGQGINVLEGNGFVNVFGAGFNDWAQQGVFSILPLDGDKLLLGRKFDGLSVWDGNSIKPLITKVDNYLKENLVSGGMVLPNGLLAISTLRGGLVLINPDGTVNKIFNRESGLPDNTINAVHIDRQNGLWLATDNGMARISLFSPVYLFSERSGLQGNVNSIVRHQGTLYVSTTQGIYYLKDISASELDKSYFKYHSTFVDIPGFYTEFHDMISMPNGLLVGTSDGIYALKNNIPERVARENTHFLQSHPADSSVLFAGLSDSLVAFGYRSGKWVRHEGFAPVVGNFTSLVLTDGTLWASTQADGLVKLVLDDNLKPSQPQYFTTAEGLPSNARNELFLIDGKMLVSTEQGLYQFDAEQGKFYPSALFGGAFNENGKRLLAVCKLSDSAYFIITNVDKGIAKRTQSGTYEVENRIFNNIADRSYSTLFKDEDDKIWLGGNQGLMRITGEEVAQGNENFYCLLRRVQVGEGKEIFSGAFYDANGTLSLEQGEGFIPTLTFNNNSIRFDFTANSYELPEFTEYQYQLVGFDGNWSGWSADTRKDYTNLPEGSYTFKVRARNAFDQISNESVFRFSVTPPWYRTWWAYMLVLVAIGILIYLIIFIRSRQLRIEKKKLEELVNERTRELKESQDMLVEQQKLASLGQLTAGIAHEIKNPLNFVNNFAESSAELLEELEEEISQQTIEEKDRQNIGDILEDLRHNMVKINEHGKRADSIVKNMLMHSRNQSGEKEATDINKMVEENVNLAYHGLRNKQQGVTVQFAKQYQDGLPQVSIIRQDISRVILNIANNAIYAAFKKKQDAGDSFTPTVSIGTKLVNDMVQISIRDNGVGISKENLSKIFNPFFTTKPTGEGTGLGLSISYDIVVKGHNGRLEVNSEEGGFTEFVISLPV